ncbi:isochorismatase family protein [Pigmentiphaga soli]|uniref:Isochorismatase family protein n=1 Tax=Pigmentiphaga soli TaxID=1007095 RepID=A0ABP8HHM1_9BURK
MNTTPETSAPWAGVIPEHELALYAAAGLGTASVRPGRAALLVIDVQYRSMGHAPAPIAESIGQYPTSCGEFGWRAVPYIARLLAAFRARGLPVIYPHVAPKGRHDGQRFADKMPAIMSIPPEGYAFVEETAPRPDDILLPKHHASAFFGTALISHLLQQKVDTLYVTGCTTSGCVRASVVDASSYGYQIVVPHEAVYDRSQVSHAVNLFDMNSKYADVMSTARALDLLSGSPT